VALLPGVAPEPADSPLDAVSVFESNDMFAIALAKGSLEDSGIPFSIDGDMTARQLVLGPIAFPLCRFLVPKDREKEARKLLAPLAFPQAEKGSS
jgi:hypothetical protein